MKSNIDIENKKYILLLHNIRSAHNVGSIFRTADACGISQIIISGYTPTPVDAFKRPVKEIAKTALGAETKIPWIYIKNSSSILKKMKVDGFQIVAIEQSEKSVDYKEFEVKDKAVFLVGNEVRGVSKQMLEKADVIVEIPMKGSKESLNVSVATGVALFRILNI